MAHHKSAIKRIRRNDRRSERNHARISRVRTFIKNVEKAVLAGDKKAAVEAFKLTQPEAERGVSKGVFHRNTISRKLSRLNASIAKMA